MTRHPILDELASLTREQFELDARRVRAAGEFAALSDRCLDRDGLSRRAGYSRPELMLADLWRITTDDETVHTYQPNEMRFLVHWNAELYEDMDELKKVMDHTDDLTHQQVVDTLLADMRSNGVKVAEPNDPFHDVDWIQALIHTYTIAPTTDWLAA